ncbi:hypothetical protein MTO96_005101 [Rhipicephalus appendiculatus]
MSSLCSCRCDFPGEAVHDVGQAARPPSSWPSSCDMQLTPECTAMSSPFQPASFAVDTAGIFRIQSFSIRNEIKLNVPALKVVSL